MTKTMLTLLMLMTSATGLQAAVGDDLTGKYLKNADFSADTPMRNGICTYGKDISANGTEFFGMQTVQSWTASNPTTNVYTQDDATIDQRASGVFAIGKDYLGDLDGSDDLTPLFLGGSGYLSPKSNSAGVDSEGNALGMVAVWTGSLAYTQEVTLPAGAYSIEIPIFNGGGTTEVDANMFGFIADDGTEYLATNKTWTVQEWETMTITFLLKEETSGKITLGYKSANVGSAASPHLYIDCVRIIEADSAPIIQAEIDARKEDLLALLESGDELGVSTTEGWNVYNNSSATLEEVEKAIESQKELNEKGMTDFTDFFINNADFSSGTTLAYGVTTYDYDMEKNNTIYYGMQPVQDWTASSPSTRTQAYPAGNTVNGTNNGRASGLFAVGSDNSIWLGSSGDVVPATKSDGSTEGNVLGFIGVWTASASYTQQVILPAGSYTITVPTYNERGTTAISKNLCGFIADDGTEYLAKTTTFTVGSWQNETIKFTLDEETSGVISVGYTAANAGSGGMPHLFVDRFTLMYNGLTDIKPSLLALQSAVRSGENYNTFDNGVYEQALNDKLNEAIEEGKDLVTAGSTDDDANTIATTAITSIITEIKSSIETYKTFKTFIDNDVTEAIEKYSDNDDFTDFTDELSDLRDTYQSAYEDGTYTTAEIEAVINGLQTRIINAVTEAFEQAQKDGERHSIDITCLYADKNLDYANSTTDGWSNETGTTGFLSRVQTAEVYATSDFSFNIYQTLSNMPKGVYEISAPGFYRTADNTSNYNQYLDGSIAGKAYIYAGGNQQLMHNVVEYAVEAKDTCHNGEISDNVYVANSNADANYIFYTVKEAKNSVVTAIASDGSDLVLGIKASDISSYGWVVWGAFTITYKGTANMSSALYEQVVQLANEAMALQDIASSVQTADQMINDAVGNTDGLDEASSEAELTAAIEELTKAIAYAKESETLIQKIELNYALYSDYLVNDVESEDEEFVNLLDQIGASVEDGYESNAQIEMFLTQLKSGYTAYVQHDVLNTSSEEQPGDITAAILNAKFTGIYNSSANEYWTVTTTGGTNGSGYNAYECYNNSSFNVSQTIYGLAEGYYRVRVQGFYRHGTHQTNIDTLAIDPEYGQYVTFFANAKETPLCNVVTGGSEEALNVTGETSVTYNGIENFYMPNSMEAASEYFNEGRYWNAIDLQVTNGELTIGLRKDKNAVNDWTIWNGFELLYLGTTTPTAVESVALNNESTNGTTGIYNIYGVRQARLNKGVNIIKSTLSNGSVKVQKVLVK